MISYARFDLHVGDYAGGNCYPVFASTQIMKELFYEIHKNRVRIPDTVPALRQPNICLFRVSSAPASIDPEDQG